MNTTERVFATEKDHDRADNLNWNGGSFGNDIAISNARKMAKLIKNPKKILGRLEAVALRWGLGDVVRPFVLRTIELHPNSKYSRAYHRGLDTGRYSMGPGRPYGGDAVENIIFNFAFDEGRKRQ